MSAKFYLTPASVEECLGYLTEFDGKGLLMAGGTDLVFKLQSGKEQAEALIDTQGIEGFDQLVFNDREVVIAAGVTHGQVAADKRLIEKLPAIAQACLSVGSPQIRNVATLAGNVVSAQPAADSAIALVALGAEAEIVSAAGSRKFRVENLYSGLGKSVIDPTQEVISAFYLQSPQPGQGSAYDRIAPRNALCLPLVNAGVWLDSEAGRITASRVVLGPVADRPFRAPEAEERLMGAGLDDTQAFKEAALAAARASSPRDSCLRGCTDYRKQLIKVLTGRVIARAAGQAGGKI
jgi:carbon-monoxide dehydrogenase medium subunit